MPAAPWILSRNIRHPGTGGTRGHIRSEIQLLVPLPHQRHILAELAVLLAPSPPRLDNPVDQRAHQLRAINVLALRGAHARAQPLEVHEPPQQPR